MQSEELHIMTELERKQLQSHLRKMYKEIETVCNRHGLRMCAGYGTVLGAVRHGGFIPWDDDMDLLMPRVDYDKLINEFADELPKNLRVYAPNSKNGPLYRFAKIVDINTRFLSPGAKDDESHGVFIDVFPLEFVPVNKFQLKWRNIYTRFLLLISACVYQRNEQNAFYKKLMCSSKKGKIIFLIREFIGLLFSWRNTSEWYDRIASYTNYKVDTKFVNVPTDGGILQSLLPYNIDNYFPATLSKFDDIEILIPNKSEDYLEHNYGEWDKIPAVEDQWQHFIEKIQL